MTYNLDFTNVPDAPEAEILDDTNYREYLAEVVADAAKKTGVKFAGELVCSGIDRDHSSFGGYREIIENWLGYPLNNNCILPQDYACWDTVLTTDIPDDLIAVMVDVDKDTGKPFRGYVKTWSEDDFWDRNEVGYGFTSVDTNSFDGLRELIPYAQYWRECDDGMEWIGADKNGKKVRGMVTDEQLGI